MVNRKKAPAIHTVTQLDTPPLSQHFLDNGIPVYVVNQGTQEVLRIEVVFHAGRPFEKKLLAARATASQIREGSAQYTAAAIAEWLDFYGSALSLPYNLDTSSFSLATMTKHLDQVLPILADCLHAPSFPAEELTAFIQRNQQKLQVELSKNDVIAYRQITEMIFGPAHPYGYNSMPETYSALRREDLMDHFAANYTSGNCQIFVSGKVDDGTLLQINRQLGKNIPKGLPLTPHLPAISGRPNHVHISRPNTLQTAIRIGRRLFSRHHPDYHGLFVLNTILGGYFGSRLMTTIREEKGYTYNIYSSLDCMRFDGYFYVGTEVGNNFAGETLEQIYREMEDLQHELIEAEELEMAKSYLMGGFLTMLDGPFNASDLVRSIITEDLPSDFFQEAIRTVVNIEPEDLRQLARTYFKKEDMFQVTVGP